jgi:hypothetical protein
MGGNVKDFVAGAARERGRRTRGGMRRAILSILLEILANQFRTRISESFDFVRIMRGGNGLG